MFFYYVFASSLSASLTKIEKEETARLWKLTAACTKHVKIRRRAYEQRWHTVFRHRRDTDKRTGTQLVRMHCTYRRGVLCCTYILKSELTD